MRVVSGWLEFGLVFMFAQALSSEKELLRWFGMSSGISQLLETAIRITGAHSANIILWKDGYADNLASCGLPLISGRSVKIGAEIMQKFNRPLVEKDGFASCSSLPARIGSFPPFVLSAPIGAPTADQILTLTCFGTAVPEQPDHALLSIISIASALFHHIALLQREADLKTAQPCTQCSSDFVAEAPAAYIPAVEQEPGQRDRSGVVSEFLNRTLVTKCRLLNRDGIAYHGLRTWRSATKDVQMAALRSLKADPPEDFVQRVAAELASEASALVGASAFEAVTNVPCGHSGPGCFAALLADQVATAMGIRRARAFADMSLAGSSHPRTNSKRPRMQLVEPMEGSVLLIDDVATSGSHIVEAAKLLRQQCSVVLPLAWIAA